MMKTILIIDDDERILRMYSKLFLPEGFKIIEAADAQTGMRLLKENKINLILLDINMPEIDGKDMFRYIQNHFCHDLKIIVSSVYSLDDQKQFIAGADDYYDKSQGIDILLEKVKNMLEIKDTD